MLSKYLSSSLCTLALLTSAANLPAVELGAFTSGKWADNQAAARREYVQSTELEALDKQLCDENVEKALKAAMNLACFVSVDLSNHGGQFYVCPKEDSCSVEFLREREVENEEQQSGSEDIVSEDENAGECFTPLKNLTEIFHQAMRNVWARVPGDEKSAVREVWGRAFLRQVVANHTQGMDTEEVQSWHARADELYHGLFTDMNKFWNTDSLSERIEELFLRTQNTLATARSACSETINSAADSTELISRYQQYCQEIDGEDVTTYCQLVAKYKEAVFQQAENEATDFLKHEKKKEALERINALRLAREVNLMELIGPLFEVSDLDQALKEQLAAAFSEEQYPVELYVELVEAVHQNLYGL